MLILDDTTKSLRIRCAAGHTTTPLRCVTSWREVNLTEFAPGNTLSSSNGTTGVEIATEPPTDAQKIIDFLSVLNTDTVTHTVTLYIYDGTTNFDLITISLAPSERIEYGEGYGFQTYNSAGAVKTIVQATQNVKSTGWSATVLGADVSNANGTANTMADVTGLSFPVVNASKYWFRFLIWYTSAAGTTGSRWSVDGPATPTALVFRSDYSLTTTTRTINELAGPTAYNTPAGSNATSPQTSLGNLAVVEGYIQPSADGTVIARFASEIASSAITAKAGSFVEYIAVA